MSKQLLFYPLNSNGYSNTGALLNLDLAIDIAKLSLLVYKRV